MPTLLDEAFGAGVNLTTAINDIALPNEPRINLVTDWDEAGIDTTKGFIEREGEVISFLPTAARGGVAQPHRSGPRAGVEVSTVHIPTRGSALADEVQDMRAFGKTTSDTPDALRVKKLTEMRKNIEQTLAGHRVGAIKGLVLDADGSVILDMFALWGVAQQVVSFALDVSGTNILTKVIDSERKSEDALGGNTPTEFVALASPSFMDGLRSHADYERRLQYAAPSALMADFRTGIAIGNTTFVEMRAPAGSPIAIEDNTAYLVPRGVEGLLIARFAPGDYVDSVNTVGQPIYARSEPMPMGKGYTLEAQSNPFHLVTRPRAIVKLTATA